MELNAIQQEIKVPQQFQKAYHQVVVAGMRLMFDPKTHGIMIRELSGPGDMATKLARGIVGLMVLLINKSGGKMPGQIVMPAAIDLLSQAAEFVEQTTPGAITNDIIARAMNGTIMGILQKMGADPSKLKPMLDKLPMPAQKLGARGNGLLAQGDA